MPENISGQPDGGTPGVAPAAPVTAPAVAPGEVTPTAVSPAPLLNQEIPAVAPPVVAAPAAAPVTGEFKAPWTGVDGVYQIDGQPWWAGIKEGPVRELMEAKRYANPDEAAVAYYNANKVVSGAADAVIVPAADAPQGQWDAFHAKMGRPEKPEEYVFKHAEGIEIDPRMENFGKELFHKLGLSPAQAQKGAEEWNAFAGAYHQDMMNAEKERNEVELNDLTSRWAGDMDANLAAGRSAMQTLGVSPELVARVEESIGTAAVVEFLSVLGQAAPEGTFRGGGGGGENDINSMTKEQAKAAIAKMEASPEYQEQANNKSHPLHNDAVLRMAALYARA